MLFAPYFTVIKLRQYRELPELATTLANFNATYHRKDLGFSYDLARAIRQFTTLPLVYAALESTVNVLNVFVQANLYFPILAPVASSSILSFWLLRPFIIHHLDKSIDGAKRFEERTRNYEKIRGIDQKGKSFSDHSEF